MSKSVDEMILDVVQFNGATSDRTKTFMESVKQFECGKITYSNLLNKWIVRCVFA